MKQIDWISTIVITLTSAVSIPLNIRKFSKKRRSDNWEKYQKLKEVLTDYKKNKRLGLYGFQTLFGKDMTYQDVDFFCTTKYHLVDFNRYRKIHHLIKLLPNGKLQFTSKIEKKSTRIFIFITSLLLYLLLFWVIICIFSFLLETYPKQSSEDKIKLLFVSISTCLLLIPFTVFFFTIASNRLAELRLKSMDQKDI